MSLVKIYAALKAQLQTVPAIVPNAALASVATGASAVFTTTAAHGLVTGMSVRLPGYTAGNPLLDGVYLVVVTGTTTFYLQNSATKNPITVIIPGSGGSVSANLTGERNSLYQPVIGVPYQLVDLVSFKPEEPTQGGGFYQEHGVFQVTLVYPVGIGLGAILARAELIRGYFKKGSSYSLGGVTVLIPETPQFGGSIPTEESIALPVKIGYLANIFS